MPRTVLPLTTDRPFISSVLAEKTRLRAKYVGDIDHGDFRAFNTRGWKSHKHRYQWEHNVIEAEKHKKNRRRKEAGRERPVSIENDR